MTTTEHADQPADAPTSTTKPALVYPKMWLLFGVLICCFTAWGVAADLTTPMVAGFKRIFDMSTFQASLVQLAYFGAYFLLAIPAAFINQRFGYKTGLLTGVLLAAAGAFAFYPASKIMTYEAFLVALFAIAAGCSILETSANPYVMSLGPEETATRRLNLAQAFNPVGTNIGVLLAATLILPKLDEPVDMATLTPAQLQTIRAGELGAVMGPYLGLGFLLIAIGLVIAIKKSPPIVEEFPDADMEGQSAAADPAVEQALRLRRRRAVLQRRGAGVHVDVPDPVRAAGAGRILELGGYLLAGQPDRLPHLALPHDLGHREDPRDQGARGARRAGRRALRVRDVLARTWPG